MVRVLVAVVCLFFIASSDAEARQRHRRHHGLPWCGIYYSKITGRAHRRDLWLARNWAREGSPAGGPAIGATVVWPHHVGKIVGRASNGQWIVHSGNDGGRVRTRPRSIAGAIAFRWV